MVEDGVDLFGQCPVDCRAHGVDSREDIVTDHLGVSQRLLCERLDRLLDARLARIIGRFELLLQQRRKIVQRNGFRRTARPFLQHFSHYDLRYRPGS